MDTLFCDYEDSLIGRKKELSNYNFYGQEAGGNNQQRALACIKYCLENILKWDVNLSLIKFDEYIVHLMKLDKVISYISFPPEVEYGDPKYILSLIYPKKVHFNQQEMIEEVYKSVLATGRQFPREYFLGTIGFYRFCACLQYLIISYHPVSCVEELYEFLLSPEGQKFLYEYRLKVPMGVFQIDLIDAIHAITKGNENADFYYSFFYFLREYERTEDPNYETGQDVEYELDETDDVEKLIEAFGEQTIDYNDM